MSARIQETNGLGNRSELDQRSRLNILAILDEANFVLARGYVEDIRAYPTHDDFLGERDAQMIGLSCAGVSAIQANVDFLAFRQWADVSGAPYSLGGLDAFASLIHQHQIATCGESISERAKTRDGMTAQIQRVSNDIEFTMSSVMYEAHKSCLAGLKLSIIPADEKTYARMLLTNWAEMCAGTPL